MGIIATDAYLLANYNKVINSSLKECEEKEQKISIQRFARIQAQHLIDMARKISGPPLKFLPVDGEASGLEVEVIDSRSHLSSSTFVTSTLLSTKQQDKKCFVSSMMPMAGYTVQLSMKSPGTPQANKHQNEKMQAVHCKKTIKGCWSVLPYL